MANNEVMIPVPGRLHSVATEGHVAGADEIFDDELNMTQSEINKTGADKPASTGTTGDNPYNGMGRVTIKKNMVSGVNTLMQEAFEDGEGNDLENTVFVIKYDFVLGEDIDIPANCVLDFNGGSISGAHTLTGTNTFINSDGVCIKSNVVIAGTWKNEIVYTRWFDLVSSNDGTTDNLVVLRQIRDIVNGTNGCKIEFEQGYYQYGCDIEPDDVIGGVPKYLTNVYLKEKFFAMSFIGLPYIDVNLKGSTLKALITNAPMFTCFAFVNIADAKIHDGSVIGFANTFDYPVYINYNNEQVRSYEWSHGIMQLGGYLTINNMFASNFHGDGIMVGSDSWWDGSSATAYIANGYIIENCEISYCARNGLSLHSSLEGRLINNHIHNIGSDAGNGEIGSDGIMGMSPRTGIDVEFEDGQGLKPVMYWDSLYIHDCYASPFGFASPSVSRMKQFTAVNLHCLGLPSTANMNADGTMEYINCYFAQTENGGANIIGSDVIYSNCVFDNLIKQLQIGGHRTVYVGCKFICGNRLTSDFVFGQASGVDATFNNCKFSLNTDTHLEDAEFNNCEFELLGAHGLFCAGSTFKRCHIFCDDSLEYTWNLTKRNVGEMFIKLEGCLIENLKGYSSALDGYSIGTYEDLSYIVKDCEFKGALSVLSSKNSLEFINSKFEKFNTRGYDLTSPLTFTMDNCVVNDFYNFAAAQNNYKAYNSRINARSDYMSSTSNELAFYNCVLGGTFDENTFTGIKLGCVFE